EKRQILGSKRNSDKLLNYHAENLSQRCCVNLTQVLMSWEDIWIVYILGV
ncbi:hypothetical protein NXF25_005239, partial [Crotalus adamanteus]